MVTKEHLRERDSNFYKKLFFKEEPKSYTITDDDIYDPGRLTYKLDLSFSLWSIVLKLNRIVDPIDDLFPGLVLFIPTLSDLRKKELER